MRLKPILKLLISSLVVLLTAVAFFLFKTASQEVEPQQPLDITFPEDDLALTTQDSSEYSVNLQPAKEIDKKSPPSPMPQISTPNQEELHPSTPSPRPAQTKTPVPNAKMPQKLLKGLVIGIDPGHQAHDNDELEPVAPGSSKQKKKVSAGTYGRFTGTREHEVNLSVGLLLRDLLKESGASVIMTRETADVNISNAERAKLFNKNNVDLAIRLHCNGSNDNQVKGAFMLIPKTNPYLEECKLCAKYVLYSYSKYTGISIDRGVVTRSDQTGFNWCERPIVNIEMGHMTNKEEDIKLSDTSFHKKMASGIYYGIIEYFKQKGAAQ